MSAAVVADRLGKRYGRRWALEDCSFELPAGRVIGLAGANGAGKTTLLHLLVGLLAPSAGVVTVLGEPPGAGPHVLARVGFLAQDAPMYSALSVGDHLRLGAHLNPAWDRDAAARRIRELGLDLHQRAGKLSGGQRAQLALTLALAKRPDLLVLDEPVAGLDPLARREFLQRLMESVADGELTVVMSSHLLGDLERVCDYLVVLDASRVQLAGDVHDLLAVHRVVTAARCESTSLPRDVEVIDARHTERQSTFVVRAESPLLDPAWSVEELGLEELVLAYVGRRARTATPARRVGLVPEKP